MDYTAHSTQVRPNSGFVLGVVREHAAGREATGVEEGLTSALLRIDRSLSRCFLPLFVRSLALFNLVAQPFLGTRRRSLLPFSQTL